MAHLVVTRAKLNELVGGDAFMGSGPRPARWPAAFTWAVASVVTGTKFSAGNVPGGWEAVPFMALALPDEVDVIARWDGWVDPRHLTNNAAPVPVSGLYRRDLKSGDAFEYADVSAGAADKYYIDWPSRSTRATFLPAVDPPSAKNASRPVTLIPRWDGFMRTVITPSASSARHYAWVDAAPSFYETRPAKPAANPFPHTCDKCGSPALMMFTSIECSRSCSPERSR